MGEDRVFDDVNIQPRSFRFNSDVAQVFDNMANRSIPFYQEVIKLIGDVAVRFAQDGTVIYDLGCSTCNTLIYLARLLQGKDVALVGYDPSEDMLAKAQEKLDLYTFSHEIKALKGDCQTSSLEKASVVCLNYTLQFVAKSERQAVLQKIYDALEPGGVLILSEKVSHDAEFISDYNIDIYYDYKKANGYSELEIAKKREALEEVLVPCTEEENLQMLKDVGFAHCDTLFKWCNFMTIVAHK